MSVQPHDRAWALLNSIPPPPFDVVHPKNKRVIARVTEDTIAIKDKQKREYIRIVGVNIPYFLRERFDNMNAVPADHPLFYEAFITAQCWDFLRGKYKIEPRQDAASAESSNQG